MTATDLRISIVGNADLKHSLSNDKKYIPELISCVTEREGSVPDQSLVDSLIIIKFLIQYNHHCVSQFHDEFVQLNDRLCEILVESMDLASSDFRLGHLLVDIISLIHLKPSNDCLFRYVLTMLTIDFEEISDEMSQMLLKSIDLIPVLQATPSSPLFLVLYEKIFHKLSLEISRCSQFKINNQEPENLKLIYKLLLNLNHMLSRQVISDYDLSLSVDLQQKLSSLFKFDNGYLNLNIIKLFFFFNIENNHIYKLIELIDDSEYKINSFNIISELVKKNEKLTDDLLKFKIDIKLLDYLNSYLPTRSNGNSSSNLSKFTSLDYLNEINLSDLLLLVSLLTYNNEELRNKFVEGYNFKPLINRLLGLYKSKLVKLAKKLVDPEHDKQHIEESYAVLQSDLFLNIFKLIRSFSRSIKVLRKFFITLNLMDNLVDILELQSLLGLNNDIELINLSIFTNSILDFSSFRSNLTSNKRFISILLKIYHKHSIPNGKIYDHQIKLLFLQFVKNLMYNENEQNKILLSRELISMNEIVSYLSYNESFVDNDPMSSEIHNLQLQQKLITFDIMRNLSSNSNYFNLNLYKAIERKSKLEWNNIILQNIINISSFQQFEHFNMECFLKMVYNDSYIDLISSINYIENHKILTIKEIVLDENLIQFWKLVLDSTLTLSADNYNKCSFNLNSIKLSIIWILLNITWPDKKIRFLILRPSKMLFSKDCNLHIKSTMEFLQQKQEYELIDLSNTATRCKWLEKMGFRQTLYDVSRTFDLAKNEYINSDLREKAQAVVEQIDGFLNDKKSERSSNVDKMDTEESTPTVSGRIESGDDSDYDIDSYWVN